MNINALQELVRLYLLEQDDEEKEEWVMTYRNLADGTLSDFLEWLLHKD